MSGPFRYFVSYATTPQFGLGHCEVIRDQPIRVFADVQAVAAALEAENGFAPRSVKILNYQTLPGAGGAQ